MAGAGGCPCGLVGGELAVGEVATCVVGVVEIRRSSGGCLLWPDAALRFASDLPVS